MVCRVFLKWNFKAYTRWQEATKNNMVRYIQVHFHLISEHVNT